MNHSTLLIDADKALRVFLRKILTPHHYIVHEAVNAETGLALAMELKPTLIILELELPDYDGLPLLRKLRYFLNSRIVVLSILNDESYKIAALDAGADAYLTKPFSEGELLARLRVVQRNLHIVKSL